MAFGRILLPTDGSRHVHLAVERAVELARLAGGRITALFVVDQTLYATTSADFEWETLGRALREQGERALAEARALAEQAGVPVETRLREGHPAQVIVEEAHEHDLVVMGTLGRSGLAHLLLGSVAERVIRHAPCPVLVVRYRHA